MTLEIKVNPILNFEVKDTLTGLYLPENTREIDALYPAEMVDAVIRAVLNWPGIDVMIPQDDAVKHERALLERVIGYARTATALETLPEPDGRALTLEDRDGIFSGTLQLNGMTFCYNSSPFVVIMNETLRSAATYAPNERLALVVRQHLPMMELNCATLILQVYNATKK